MIDTATTQAEKLTKKITEVEKNKELQRFANVSFLIKVWKRPLRKNPKRT